ncbi:MAG TPA: hypothetical protein VN668_10445 [Stellaceae bacterium]|nr:hypothetical protein [Stellaceae bacterium]
MNRFFLALTILASFVNAVPSRAEFHPVRYARDPISDSFMGSGLETCGGEALTRTAACEEPTERSVARQWRELAARVRRLAALYETEEKASLMAKAAEYERRAQLLEEQPPQRKQS